MSMAAREIGLDCIPRKKHQREQLKAMYVYRPTIIPPGARSYYSSCPDQTYNGGLLPLKFDVGLTTFLRDFTVSRAIVKIFAKELPAELAPNATDPPIPFKLVILETSRADKSRNVSTIRAADIISTRLFNSEDPPLFLRLNVKPFFNKLSKKQRAKLKTVSFGVGIQNGEGEYLDWRKYLVGVDCARHLAPLDSVPQYILGLNMGGKAAQNSHSPALDLVSYRKVYAPGHDPSQEILPLCSKNAFKLRWDVHRRMNYN